MEFLKNIFIVIWRGWFFLWSFTTVIILLPILVIVISKSNWYSIYFKIARIWAKTILFIMGFWTKIEFEEIPEKDKSYMFCPNHTSMIDIMLLLSITKNPFVFVGKKELGKYPLFGYIYKRTSILVDRNNSQSKIEVFNAAKKCIQNNLSICIFPEGKVPDDESIILDHFQNGTFRLAIENQKPIVPMTFFDCKKRFSYTFLSGSPGELRVKVHNFISTKGTSLTDRNIIKNKIFDVIRNSLLANKSYMESSLTSKINH
jgi:1-acyl-sn-glycerol-3-phosphate acyltransferase